MSDLEKFTNDLEKQNNKTVVSGGIGFVGLLQIVFIVLKLCGVITWHWALVLLPLIIEAGLFVIVLILGVICACILAGKSN